MLKAQLDRYKEPDKYREQVLKNDVKSLMKTFDLSIPIGISYEYMNLQLDLRYNHGLTSLGDFFDKGHNRSIVLTLGYGIDF